MTTDLFHGHYVPSNIANPGGIVQESSTDINSGAAHVRVTGDRVWQG